MIKPRLTEKTAGILLTLTALIWGSGFICYKYLMGLLMPVPFVVLRSLFAAVCSGIFFVLYIKRVNRRELLCGCTLGCILAVAGLIQTYGIRETSAGNCAFLTGTNVVMVPFLSWALAKRKPNRYQMVSAAAMFAGVCLLTVDFDHIAAVGRGDLLSFMGAFFYAIHIAVTGLFAGQVRPLAMIPLQFLSLFAVNLVFLLVSGGGMEVPAEAVLPAAYLGVVVIFAGHSLQMVCQERTNSAKAAVLLSLEGVFGSLFGVLLLGERYALPAIGGFALIFASILLSQAEHSQ